MTWVDGSEWIEISIDIEKGAMVKREAEVGKTSKSNSDRLVDDPNMGKGFSNWPW